MLAVLVAACGTGTRTAPTAPNGPTTAGSAPTAGAAPTADASSSVDGGRVTVTVPDLPTADPAASPSGSAATDGDGTAQTAASSGTTSAEPTVTATATVTAPPTPPPSVAGSALLTGVDSATVTSHAAIDLSACAGCTVIATHPAVAGPLSAAFTTAPRGAVLLALRPDGSVAGVVNVLYGASFPAPAGGVLPCDRSGRCVVTARQANGNAVLSAFQLASDGTWRDVSGNDAFPSATARGVAVDLTGDGLLDIAVQESAGTLTGWLVFSWSGDRFTVLGCAPDSTDVPPAAQLSKDVCLS